MVQILPSGAEGLAAGLSNLIAGIDAYRNPNRELIAGMQKALLTNPELYTKLADIEAGAPGTLGSMGLGDLAPIIARTPESVGSEVNRRTRPQQVATGTATAQANAGKAQISADTVSKAMPYLQSSDPKQRDIGLNMLSGKTTDEVTIERNQARKSTVDADVAEAQAPGEIKEAQYKAEMWDDVFTNIPMFKDKDPRQIYAAFKAGQIPMPMMASIMASPPHRAAFEAAEQLWQTEQSLIMRENEQALRGERSPEETALINKAFRWHEITGGAGSYQAWKALLSDPNARETVAVLKAKPAAELTQPERDLITVHDARDKQTVAEHRQIATGISTNIHRAMTAIKATIPTNDEAARNLAIGDLNTALEQRAELGAPRITARYGERPEVGQAAKTTWGTWGEGKGIYFVNEEGLRVPDAEALRMPEASMGVEAIAAEGFARYSGLKTKAEKDAFAKRLGETNPEAKAIFDRMVTRSTSRR